MCVLYLYPFCTIRIGNTVQYEYVPQEHCRIVLYSCTDSAQLRKYRYSSTSTVHLQYVLYTCTVYRYGVRVDEQAAKSFRGHQTVNSDSIPFAILKSQIIRFYVQRVSVLSTCTVQVHYSYCSTRYTEYRYIQLRTQNSY